MRSIRNIKSIGAVILVASIAGNVYSAEGDVYLGIGYGMVTSSVSGLPDFEPTALVVRYGNFTTDNFAAEVRLGTGLSDDTQDIGLGVDVTIDIDQILGLYGSYYSGTSSSTTRAYGILGFTQGEFTVSGPAFGSFSDSDSDISFGLGVNFAIGENGVINLEYMDYMEIEGTDITAIAIGYNGSFK
jgi:hypothetical protein